MSDATHDGVEIREADWRFAVRLLQRGKPFPAVEAALLARGLSPDQAAAILQECFVQSIYAEAEHLLDGGESLTDIVAALVARGLSTADAVRVVTDVQQFRQDQERFFRHAVGAVVAGRGRRDVEAELLGLGASPQIAAFVVRAARRAVRSAIRKAGFQNLAVGLGVLLLGVVVTAATLVFAGFLGLWVVMGGLLVSGAGVFFRGLFQLVTGRDVE